MNLFAENRFFMEPSRIQRESLKIMDVNMKTLGYVRHNHSLKIVAWWIDEIKCTNMRIEGADGMLIGEMQETPFLAPNRLTIWKAWRIIDAKGDFRGAVMERLSRKYIVGFKRVVELEDAEGKAIAEAKGDLKKRDYEVLDVHDQVIARCSRPSKEYYVLDLLSSSFSPFLVLCYVIVLDHTTHWYFRGGS